MAAQYRPEADPLADRDLALQREGRAGRSTTRGSTTSAARCCRERISRSRSASPAARSRPSRCCRWTAGRSATRPRSSPPWRRRYPDRRSTRRQPEERARALELEDWFDEKLGPHARLLPFHDLIQEPELFAEIAAESVPGPLGKAKPVVGAYARAYTSMRWGEQRRRRRAGTRGDRRRARQARVRAGQGQRRVPRRRQPQRRRRHRRLALLPGGRPARGPPLTRPPPATRLRRLPRRTQRPPRLPLGRRDLPQAPLAAEVSLLSQKFFKEFSFYDKRLHFDL